MEPHRLPFANPQAEKSVPLGRLPRIVLVALIFAGALYRYWPVETAVGPCGTGFESLELACSLAHQGTYANPFAAMQTGPSAHIAPLFPLMASAFIRHFGDTARASNAIEWMATLVLALQLSLWPWFAERLEMGFAAGAIGACAWLTVGFILPPMWEAPEVCLVVLLVTVCVRQMLTARVTLGFVALTGVLWGVALLFNPAPLVVFVALAAWVCCVRGIPSAQKLALVLVPALIVSPWLIRNYVVFHHFVLIRDNLGTELWDSNNPCATFSFKANRATNCFSHPNESVAEAAQARALGEYTYNQAKLRDAVGWIEANPARFAELTKERFLAFWFYTPGGNYFAGQSIPASIYIIWLGVPLGLAGLVLLWRADRTSFWLCLAWLALYSPIYYFVEFIPRYRYPILWATFLPAAFCVKEAAVWSWARLRGEDRPRVAAKGRVESSEWTVKS